jgi:NitT/TauT family transport system permease protein
MKLHINPALVVVVVALAAWQFSGRSPGLVSDMIGTPTVIAGELVNLLRSPELYSNLGVTVFEFAVGLMLATIFGLALALGFGTDQRAHDVLEPFLIIGNTVPKVILLPAFLMLLGTGVESKIAFGALHGMLPIAFMVSNGARKTIGSEQVRAALVMDASRTQIIRTVIFPSVLPYLVSALRLAVSLTLLGVILGEMYIARAGLGFLLMRRYSELQISSMLSIVVLIGCIAATIDFTLRTLERKIWRSHGFRQGAS